MTSISLMLLAWREKREGKGREGEHHLLQLRSKECTYVRTRSVRVSVYNAGHVALRSRKVGR